MMTEMKGRLVMKGLGDRGGDLAAFLVRGASCLFGLVTLLGMVRLGRAEQRGSCRNSYSRDNHRFKDGFSFSSAGRAKDRNHRSVRFGGTVGGVA